MIDKLRNQLLLEAERASTRKSSSRMGIIDGYDPDHYSVKVRIQPENILTGWLPIASPWVGDQWGMYCGPSLGDVVDVHFEQGDPNAAYVEQRFFSTSTRPLPVPSQEFWLVHKSGSVFKLHNDGSVEVTAATTLRMVAADIQIHATNSYRFDVNGHGQHWFGNKIDTYQIGEVPGATNAISPPEIG